MKIEEAIGLSAKLLLAAQTQYKLDSAQPKVSEQEHETVNVTIPVRDHNLFCELVKRLGWTCVF